MTKRTAVVCAFGLLALTALMSGRLPVLRAAAATCTSPPPAVTGISPDNGPPAGGTIVVITGCGFTGATGVTFGSANAAFMVNSDSQITSTSPAHVVGKVDIAVTTTAGTSATGPGDQFSYNGRCLSLNNSANPPPPQPIGTTVALSLTATPCPNPRYRFELLPPGSQTWLVKQDYSTASSYTWDTASLPPGQYLWIMKARDVSSTGAWDVYAVQPYDITQPAAITPCTMVSLSVAPGSPSSPQTAGTSVSVLADPVLGCPSPRFQFELLRAGSSTWTVAQAYSTGNTYAWDTTSLPAGVYTFIAKARDATSLGTNGAGNPNGTWDAYATLGYSILNGGPCTGADVTPAPATPQATGTTVTFTVTASGCPTTPRYQFEVLAPGAGSYQVAQPYSASNTFNWNTGRNAAGAYVFIIKVEDRASGGLQASQGNPNGTWDAFTVVTYTLTSTPCAVVTVALSGSVTMTAHATGCPTPQYQFEMFSPGSSTWEVVQPYSSGNSFTWSSLGSFTFIVKARDLNSAGTAGAGNPNGSWDAYAVTNIS